MINNLFCFAICFPLHSMNRLQVGSRVYPYFLTFYPSLFGVVVAICVNFSESSSKT